MMIEVGHCIECCKKMNELGQKICNPDKPDIEHRSKEMCNFCEPRSNVLTFEITNEDLFKYAFAGENSRLKALIEKLLTTRKIDNSKVLTDDIWSLIQICKKELLDIDIEVIAAKVHDVWGNAIWNVFKSGIGLTPKKKKNLNKVMKPVHFDLRDYNQWMLQIKYSYSSLPEEWRESVRTIAHEYRDLFLGIDI